MDFVDLETARKTPGLRLVVLAAVPSPWSQAAKAIFELKRIEGVVVRLQLNDQAVKSWTGVHNAPVALYNDEPARSGWAEILALAERLQPEPSLVPSEAQSRALMFGFSHELMGEGGLIWNSRLLSVDAAIESDGKEAYPVPIARHLGGRYGYTPGCGPAAHEHVLRALAALDEQLQHNRASGSTYYIGDRLSALDLYSAMTMNTLAPLPEAQCAMHPIVRTAFEWTHAQLQAALPPALVRHRDMMFERHLTLPIQL